MKIIDINGKVREIIDNSMKKIDHEVPALGPHAKKGEMLTVKFVQVLIKPRTKGRTPWLEWYPLKQFVKDNPGVKL